MAKIKTHKSIAKRVKVTKNGKLKTKKAGQGHFNNREASKTTRAKRRPQSLSQVHDKNIKSLLPYS